MSLSNTIPRFTKALQFVVNNHLGGLLTTIVVFVSLGYGTTFILDEDLLSSRVTYAIIVEWAPIETWGVGIVILSVLLGLIAPAGKQEASWVGLGLTLLYGVLTIGTAIATIDGGIPTAVWAYMFLTLTTGLVTLILSFSDQVIPRNAI